MMLAHDPAVCACKFYPPAIAGVRIGLIIMRDLRVFPTSESLHKSFSQIVEIQKSAGCEEPDCVALQACIDAMMEATVGIVRAHGLDGLATLIEQAERAICAYDGGDRSILH